MGGKKSLHINNWFTNTTLLPVDEPDSEVAEGRSCHRKVRLVKDNGHLFYLICSFVLLGATPLHFQLPSIAAISTTATSTSANMTG